MKSAPAIAFDYRPSRLLAMVVGGITALAIAASLQNGLEWPWRVLLSVSATALGCLVLFRHLKSGFVRIAHGASGWTLVDGTGQEHPANLLAHVQRNLLLILEFGGGSLPCTRFILAPDNCDAELRRRLLLVLAAGERKRKAEPGG